MYCLFCMVFPELLLYWLFYDNKSIVLIALILSLANLAVTFLQIIDQITRKSGKHFIHAVCLTQKFLYVNLQNIILVQMLRKRKTFTDFKRSKQPLGIIFLPFPFIFYISIISAKQKNANNPYSLTYRSCVIFSWELPANSSVSVSFQTDRSRVQCRSAG